MVSFYNDNKDDIIETRKAYQTSVERIKNAKTVLAEKVNIKHIVTPDTSKNEELSSILIVLKQLIKILDFEENSGNLKKNTRKIDIEKVEIKIDGKLEFINNCLRIPLKISDEQLKSMII